MREIVVFTILFCVVAIWFMRVRIGGYSAKDAGLKSVAAVLLACIGALCFRRHPTVLGGWLLAGGVLGGVGDVLLGFSHISRQRKRRHFFTKGGFLFFGLGHICYLLGYVLWQSGMEVSRWYVLIPLLLGGCMGTFFGVFGRRLGLHFGRYMGYVIFYGSVLVASVALAVSLNLMTHFSVVQLRLFALGMACFIVSDLILSRTYFGKGGKSAFDVIANHVTYYLAQYLIAVSILYV